MVVIMTTMTMIMKGDDCDDDDDDDYDDNYDAKYDDDDNYDDAHIRCTGVNGDDELWEYNEHVFFRLPVMRPTPHIRSLFISTAKGNYASMIRAAIPQDSSAGQAIGTDLYAEYM